MNKMIARKRRGAKTKAIIGTSKRPRLVVHRSSAHIYSQIIVRGENGDEIIAAASTLDKELRNSLTGSKTDQAVQVGTLLAKRAKSKKVIDVAFDRAGYKYHGRIKALANGAREGGLNF